MNSLVSSRIAMLRFLMIFGVVVLHTPLYVPIADTPNGAFSLVKAFFQQAFFRGSVPVLTAISGYLLFSSSLDQSPKKLFFKKFKALVIPFLVFNLSVLAVAVYTHQLSLHTVKEWADAAFGFSSSPANYPLNFLRDMVVLMLLVPFLSIMARNYPITGLLFLFMFFMGNYDGLVVLRNDMPIVFYVGALAAVYQWDLTKLDRYAPHCLLLFTGMCIFWIAQKIPNTNILRFAAPILLWPAVSMLHSSTIGAWLERMSKYSFFVFLAHAPLLAVSWKLYEKCPVVPYPVYWITAPVAVVASLVVAYKAAMWIFPNTFKMMIGVGGAKTKAIPKAALTQI